VQFSKLVGIMVLRNGAIEPPTSRAEFQHRTWRR
jgi:hypothetical protein